MTVFKNIFLKLFWLLADILVLGFHALKQLVLPSRTRKGNVLTSLFIFFINLIERLNVFKLGKFEMRSLFQNKYIRRAVFLLVSILFLLSLLESPGHQTTGPFAQSVFTQSSFSSEECTDVPEWETAYIMQHSSVTLRILIPLCADLPNKLCPPSSFCKKYIFIRSMRI